jgi:MATE family multidrug resistance protein
MVVAGSVFAGYSHLWASLYTNSPEVVIASQPIFAICALLLMTDTTADILAAALTGLGDTLTPMIVSLICNWGCGMSLAYVLAFHYHQSLRGLWLGRAAGSALSAVAMVVVWQIRMRRTGRSPATLSLLDSLRVPGRPSLAGSQALS